MYNKTHKTYRTYKIHVTYFVLFVLLCSFFVMPQKIVNAGVLSRPPTNLGLMLYWNLDEGRGIKMGDSSGQNNTGTNTNTSWVSGKKGGALNFNGTNNYIYSSNAYVSATVFPDVTISAWIKTTSASGKKILGFESGQTGTASASYDRHLYVNADGKAVMGVYDGAVRTAISTSTVATGEWILITGTFNDTANLAKIYINGKFEAQVAASNAQSYTGYWRVGSYKLTSWPLASDGYFPGSIDDVRIYNRTLSDAEVANLYQSDGAKLKTVSNQGLVGYWPMNEGRGNKAGDGSGQGNTGTVTGASWTNGKRGKALNFNGSSDRVLVSDASILRISNNFSISFWFKPVSTSQSSKYLLARNNAVGVNQSSIIYEYVNDQVEFFAQSFSGTDPRTNSQIPVTDTNWHHIVYAYDGTTWAGYKDGANIFSVNRTFSLSTAALDGWYIGSANGSAGFFGGVIDEVRIYNRALSATEIQSLYKQSSATIGTSYEDRLTNGLVGNWTMNGKDYNSASTTAEVLDKSGNGNNGDSSGTTQAIGKLGQALNFNGTTNGVIVPDSASLDLASSLTLSVWFYGEDSVWPSAYQGIVSKRPTSGGSANYGFNIYNNASPNSNDCTLTNGLQFYFSNVSWKGIDISTNKIPTRQWVHAVGVFEDTGADLTAKVYINGVLEGSATCSSTSLVPVNGPLYIGKSADSMEYFKGKIDEVRIYNRALSTDEVRQLYNMGK